MTLIKKFCKDVTFDEERARESLKNTSKYKNEEKREAAIQSLKKQFEIAKKANKIFTMKTYKPVHGRVGFIDFLKFATPEQQKLYETLKQGAEVLICDDFLTTEATVKEAIRFLNSINPDTKISVFILINQYRDL